MNNKKKENKKIPQYVVVNEEESQYRMGLMTFKPNLSIDKLDKILT